MKIRFCKSEIEYDTHPSGIAKYHHTMHYCFRTNVGLDHIHECEYCDFIWGNKKSRELFKFTGLFVFRMIPVAEPLPVW